MRIIILSGSFLIFTLILFSCKKNNPVVPPPPEPPKAVTLSLVDVSCTEAFIRVAAADSVLPVLINLTKDEAPLLSFTLSKTDTVVIDTILQPNTTYTYQTSALINGEEELSDTLQVPTLKITSNSFIWQTYTFGNPGAGSSSLSNIAIINDSDIWAVGEIYKLDTLGQPDPKAYNAVHWDGKQWEVKRIRYYGTCSAVEFPPLYAIWAFSDKDIILTNGGSIGIFNGETAILNCGVNSLLTGIINKVWGTSDNDIYVVGNSGNIVHFNGLNWTRIESGTTANLRDIFGVKEPTTDKLKILVTAERLNDYRILTLTPTSAADTLNWVPETHLSGIWLDGRKTYAAGTDIWVNRYDQWQQKTFTGYFFTTMRGSKSNNIYGIGPDGIVHFNGEDWQLIKQRPAGIVMLSGSCNNNLVVAAGFSTSGGVVGEAVVLLGYKEE